ncbi:sensor histidine kinase [Actinotalea subterranea]|uniref:sensor histidine kinase n=1 Tax=Actinotalea subterranea TaxID=2607497 RepID=UPI001FE655A8|nr:sensor histidine kinase [Actinotalea subterranea]
MERTPNPSDAGRTGDRDGRAAEPASTPPTEPAVTAVAPVADPDAPGWRRAPLGPDERRADALLAGGLLVGALLSLVLTTTAGIYDDPAAPWASVLCLLAVTAPLAWRRRWPSAVVLLTSVAFVASGVLQVPETLFANIALFVALYTVGAWDPDRRRATWVRLVVVVGMFVWLLATVFIAVTDPDSMPGISRAGAFSPLVAFLLIQVLTNILYFAGAYYFGDHSWASARERARTAWRGRQLQLERQLVERQAVAIERLRLARELHDAVAHHVSMMGVQAAAARTVLGMDPARAAAALEGVEESAREAVHELHGVLGTLRDVESWDLPDGGAYAVSAARTAGGAGQPAAPGDPVGSLTVDQIPALVARCAETGQAATFQVVGEPVRLPPLVSLNMYRITQEALTNTRKHGGPDARADVRLRYVPGAVELEIADDGVGPLRSRQPGSGGLGLVGMRERVAADGGSLEVGPRSRGGFLVRATVPLAHAGARS